MYFTLVAKILLILSFIFMCGMRFLHVFQRLKSVVMKNMFQQKVLKILLRCQKSDTIFNPFPLSLTTINFTILN